MQNVLFQRQQKPRRQKKYQDYKPYLRKDFRYRCAYCLIHEAHYGGLRNFHVDHFRPKSKGRFRRLALTYANLYYACGLCNTFKGDHWPSSKQLKSGFRFVDPCQEDPYGTDFEVVEEDGSLRILTDAGRYTVVHLRLDRNQLRRHRRREIEQKQKCQVARDLLGTPGLPLQLVAETQRLVEEIEQSWLNPVPPYELEDLRT